MQLADFILDGQFPFFETLQFDHIARRIARHVFDHFIEITMLERYLFQSFAQHFLLPCRIVAVFHDCRIPDPLPVQANPYLN